MKRTISQNKELYGLLNRLQILDQKSELVLIYTNHRTESSSKMTKAECERMLIDLRGQKSMTEKRSDRMRKKIISMMVHELGWTMDKLYQFCIKSGYLKKPLNDYSYEELPLLVTQFGNILESYIPKLLTDD